MTLVEYKVSALDAQVDEVGNVIWVEVGAIFKRRVVGEAAFDDVNTLLYWNRREEGFRIV